MRLPRTNLEGLSTYGNTYSVYVPHLRARNSVFQHTGAVHSDVTISVVHFEDKLLCLWNNIMDLDFKKTVKVGLLIPYRNSYQIPSLINVIRENQDYRSKTFISQIRKVCLNLTTFHPVIFCGYNRVARVSNHDDQDRSKRVEVLIKTDS
jgi:hypothetical protein